MLTESVPYYPLNLDLLYVGLAALMRVFAVHPNKAAVSESYVDCFTTLLAVEEEPFRAELMADFAEVIPKMKVAIINTAVVDLLLVALARFDNQNLTCNCLIVLGKSYLLIR